MLRVIIIIIITAIIIIFITPERQYRIYIIHIERYCTKHKRPQQPYTHSEDAKESLFHLPGIFSIFFC